jgi:hypothetical protein
LFFRPTYCITNVALYQLSYTGFLLISA